MILLDHLKFIDVAIYVIPFLLAAYGLARTLYYRGPRATQLRGPPRKSFLFGASRDDINAIDPGARFEDWQAQYGPVFQIPGLMGSNQIVLCDPKAIANFYSKDTYGYRQPPAARFLVETYFGRNVIWAEADTHKRQRKALSSAFSNAAIRKHTSVFYDSAYSLKNTWDSLFQADPSNDVCVIDVQKWMNYISLDSIGTAGFSHEFGALKGKPSPIVAAFDSFGNVKPSIFIMLSLVFAPMFPALAKIPNQRNLALKGLRESVKGIADDLLERAKAEQEAKSAVGEIDKSIIGTLIRSENTEAGVQLSHEEVLAQVCAFFDGVSRLTDPPPKMHLLILAGYETTAISLTWALTELSRNPKEQEKLRAELAQFTTNDPTWEQLTYGLPYLDAVICEVLRLHPAVPGTIRMAHEDNIIPLGQPTHDANGNLIDHIFVPKGSAVRVSIVCMNRSEVMWGKTGKDFIPSRWLDDGTSQERSAEIQGHRHLLTFVDGPRSCLGKVFALTEFKAVLSVLIRNYRFELPDGPTTKIGSHRSILPRPKVEGQEGPRLPLLVRRVDG